MGRLIARLAMTAAGALPLLVSTQARPAAPIRTSASLEIRDAASLSVVGDAPLQLLLSSGGETMFTLTPGSTSGGANGGSAALVVNGSGAWAGTTASGEVLSVSVAAADGSTAAEGSAGAADAPQARFVIAQFN